MPGSFEIKTSGDGFMFNLKAANGQVILTSQKYATKQGALDGVESVRVNSPVDERYDRATSSNGKPFFRLLAANKQTIGNSEMYNSDSARDSGIASVKSNGATAAVKDAT
jgi:uncharacterized protein YegP (UPF0339 family)